MILVQHVIFAAQFVCADINTITAKFYIYKKTDPEKIRPDEEIVVCNTCHSIYKKMDKYIKH